VLYFSHSADDIKLPDAYFPACGGSRGCK